MSDKPWKRFEREVARLLGGRRFWANSGESIDIESSSYVAQCKHVAQMSLRQITDLAEAVELDAAPKAKLGIVALKLRAGRGRTTSTLFVMTSHTWELMNGAAGESEEEG